MKYEDLAKKIFSDKIAGENLQKFDLNVLKRLLKKIPQPKETLSLSEGLFVANEERAKRVSE